MAAGGEAQGGQADVGGRGIGRDRGARGHHAGLREPDAISGAACALAVELKWKLGFDDSLDVVGIHLVGGMLGTVYLGFFATGTGLLVGGGVGQLIVQLLASVGVMVYAFVAAFLIGFAIEKTIGFRVTDEDELAGVDRVVHGEDAYGYDLERV